MRVYLWGLAGLAFLAGALEGCNHAEAQTADTRPVVVEPSQDIAHGQQVAVMTQDGPSTTPPASNTAVRAVSPLLWQRENLKRWKVKGGDPNAMPDSANTMIMIAAQQNDEKAIVELVHAGADINKPGKAGTDALDSAMTQDQKAMALFLIKHGADPARLNPAGTSPLYIAAAANDIDLLTLSVHQKADLNKKAGIACSALGRAILSGKPEAATFLMDHGGKFLDRDYTPIHYATMIGCYPTQWDLLVGRDKPAKPGRIPRSRFSDQKTESLSPSMIKLLVKHGYKVDAKNSVGRTPLHIAALADNVEAAKALLAMGAHRDTKDKQGKTAADLALKVYSVRVYKLLTGKTIIAPVTHHGTGISASASF